MDSINPQQNQAMPVPPTGGGQPLPTGGTPQLGGTPAPQLSQEEMRANLQELMAKIDGKYQDFVAHKSTAESDLKIGSGESLRNLFDFLQSQGVDPSDPEAVKVFLDELKAKNPELAQQVEEAFQAILGEEDAAPEEGMTPEGEEGLPPREGLLKNMNITNPNELQKPPENL